jgi:hypothetical protein
MALASSAAMRLLLAAMNSGPSADEIHLSCREVLTRGTRRVEMVGPALEDEARNVFDKYRE